MKTISENADRIKELKDKKKMLERSNQVLLDQLLSIDLELKISQMEDDAEKINEYTDILNTMFQDPAIERHAENRQMRIYELMNDLDKAMIRLQDDIEVLKNDLSEAFGNSELQNNEQDEISK
jgi:uncharacterized protein (UPF0147 family)